MKKVVVKLTTVPEIALFSVSEEKYYGFERNDGVKGFLSRCIGRPEMLLLACRGLTGGNNWNHLGARSIEETIKNILNTPGFSVYEFETSKKLFEWLAQ